MRAFLCEFKLSVIMAPPDFMREERTRKYSMCSCLVASKKAKSKRLGVMGMDSGAWPGIWVMTWLRPAFWKFFVAR